MSACTTSVETFECDKMRLKLSRSACGARYRREQDMKGQRGVRAEIRVGPCRTCLVGKAHAHGEHPDVPLVLVITHGQGWKMKPRTCAHCGQPMPLGSKRKHHCSLACMKEADRLTERLAEE